MVTAVTLMLGLFIAEQKYLPVVQKYAAAENVPAALILAVIRQESNFDPNAYRAEPQIDDASAGLMQLLLGTAQSMNPNVTEDDLYDPDVNISLGTIYLRRQLDRYSGNIKDAISAYNAGSAYVYDDGSYSNESYVDNVYNYYQTYTAWLQSGSKTVDLATVDPASFIFAGVIAWGGYKWLKKR